MHKQRLSIFLISLLGILLVFMPWFQTVHGIIIFGLNVNKMAAGYITLILFIVTLGFSLTGLRKEKMAKQFLLPTILINLVILIFCILIIAAFYQKKLYFPYIDQIEPWIYVLAILPVLSTVLAMMYNRDEEEHEDHIPSLDELVFANRNHEYGAYVLRQRYPKYVSRAMTVAIIALFLSVAIPLIASYYNKNRNLKEDKTVGAEFIDPNKPPEDKPPPPPPPPPEALEQKVKFTAPVVTTDTVVETNALNQDDLSQKVTNVAVDENDFKVEEKVVEKVIEQEDKTPIFTVVEEMPSFPGGEEARLKFLQENIQYPQVAKESGISGTVYISFVVDSKGKVTDVKIQRGIGGGCDEEAIRVIKLMPGWNPGKQAGKSVRVQFTMPIRFTLN